MTKHFIRGRVLGDEVWTLYNRELYYHCIHTHTQIYIKTYHIEYCISTPSKVTVFIVESLMHQFLTTQMSILIKNYIIHRETLQTLSKSTLRFHPVMMAIHFIVILYKNRGFVLARSRYWTVVTQSILVQFLLWLAGWAFRCQILTHLRWEACVFELCLWWEQSHAICCRCSEEITQKM